MKRWEKMTLIFTFVLFVNIFSATTLSAVVLDNETGTIITGHSAKRTLLSDSINIYSNETYEPSFEIRLKTGKFTPQAIPVGQKLEHGVLKTDNQYYLLQLRNSDRWRIHL